MRRILLAAAAAAAIVAAAGCGSAGPGVGAGSPSLGGGAAVAPASTVAFAAVDSDVSSSQLQTVSGLLAALPGGGGDLETRLQQALQQKENLSWNDDVKPALGPELDLLAVPVAGKPQLVGLTQPADGAKLTALLAKLDPKAVTAQVNGWTAFSDTKAALDAIEGSATSLADDNTFQAATAKLAGDALVQAYANGAEAQQLLAALGRGPSTVPFDWASADAVATSTGVRLDGYSHASATAPAAPAPYASTLVDTIPSGALAVADFEAPSQLPATLPAQLRSILTTLGGETALYVSPGLPPAVTLVTSAADPDAAAAAIDQALAGLGGQGGMLGALIHPPLPHATVDGRLVVSTSTAAIQAYRAAGDPLSADPTFRAAGQAAGMPAQTTGFLYVNVKDALPLVKLLGPLAGVKLPAELGGLRTLTAFGGRTGDEQTFRLSLQAG